MSSSNNNEVISIAKPHTIKKFELIATYVNDWAHTLLGGKMCERLIFIDCMCNSGEYYDESNNTIIPGTAARIAKILRDISFQYPSKRICLLLNDINERKIEHLSEILPKETSNFKIHISCEDASDFLKKWGKNIPILNYAHTLLVYDPYNAAVDWEAIKPFFNTWGEVILNHMVFDAARNVVREIKKKDLTPDKIHGIEQTYKSDFVELIPFGSDKKAYEERVENIMANMRERKRETFIAAFPFFSRTNGLIYNLIHYTNNQRGFNLFKKAAWQTFGGKSSDKNTHGNENQLTLDSLNTGIISTNVDEECYYLKDIAEYLQRVFVGQRDVPKQNLWNLLEQHPVFPTEGFKKYIINELKQLYEADVNKSTVTFKGGINI